MRGVLSLFDGMSCLQIALKELAIIPDIYYASEIDKHAIKQTQLNFQNTVQLGSVTEWRTWSIDWSEVDLIGAGSPCQGFSFAGKQLAFDDERSKLFFVFVKILNHCKKFNPDVKFLLENVNMKREYMRIISEYVGVFPVNINSRLVSAQNRDRWYWSNIRIKAEGLFDDLYTDIPQPEDLGIVLKDILEDEVEEKYYISNTILQRIIKPKINPDKAYACVQNNNTSSFGNSRSATLIINIEGKPKPNQQKASCFTAGAHSGGNHSDMDLICVAMRGRGDNNEQQLEPNHTGKTNTLTSVQKDNLVMQLNPSTESGGKQPYQQNRVYDSDVIFQAIMTENRGFIKYDRLVRRLTPTECARLQTVPEWYRWECSDTQQYRMLGNGWTINVITHILSFYTF